MAKKDYFYIAEYGKDVCTFLYTAEENKASYKHWDDWYSVIGHRHFIPFEKSNAFLDTKKNRDDNCIEDYPIFDYREVMA